MAWQCQDIPEQTIVSESSLADRLKIISHTRQTLQGPSDCQASSMTHRTDIPWYTTSISCTLAWLCMPTLLFARTTYKETIEKPRTVEDTPLHALSLCDSCCFALIPASEWWWNDPKSAIVINIRMLWHEAFWTQCLTVRLSHWQSAVANMMHRWLRDVARSGFQMLQPDDKWPVTSLIAYAIRL